MCTFIALILFEAIMTASILRQYPNVWEAPVMQKAAFVIVMVTIIIWAVGLDTEREKGGRQ